MRLVVIGLAVLFLTWTRAVCLLTWTRPAPVVVDAKREAVAAFKSYRGRDLRNLPGDEVSALYDHASVLVVAKHGWPRPWDGPWHVWDYGKGSLVMDGTIAPAHPGWSYYTLTLLRDDGTILAQTHTATSYRSYVRRAWMEQGPDGEPLIVFGVGMRPWDEDEPITKVHYYGRIGARFDLVRLEDSRGQAVRIHYLSGKHRCGPMDGGRERTEQECIADLGSGDRLRVLRTLMWLGGNHWDLEPPGPRTAISELGDQVRLVRRLRADPRVKAWADSPDGWLRDAAEHAANPEDEH